MVEDFFEDHIFWAFTSWEIVVGVAVGMFGFLGWKTWHINDRETH